MTHATRIVAAVAVLVALAAGVQAQTIDALRERAEQGDATAQYFLGDAYDFGKGVPEDDAEAVRWYRLAAEQGSARAQVNLGFAYANGQGVPEDYAEAVRWYRLAAEQGDADAQYNLGVHYGNGEGVPQDDVQAHMWFNLAASRMTGEMREKTASARDEIRALMTPEQVAEAQRLAREWDEAHPR